jgi:hypothetical protein
MRHEVNSPHVISETIQGECIVINLSTGTYYSLQGTGAEVWEAIAGAATAAEVAGELAQRYGIEPGAAEQDVAAVVAELLSQELIVPSAATERVAAPSAVAPAGEYVPPSLSVYTDMQDLVLLDPVHEVTDAGWPEAKPQAAGA